VKRDILRRSAIGLLYTDRSISSTAGGPNRAVGVDAVLSFYQNLNINAYFAKTKSDLAPGRDTSYRAQLDYNGDRYGFQVERVALDDRFRPDMAFLRRSAFTRNSVYGRFSPRPKSLPAVRKFGSDVTFDYITDPNGRLESRFAQGALRADLQNGDNMGIELVHSYELLKQPFQVARNVVIPTGGYSFPEVHFLYYFGPQRRVSTNLIAQHGSFYGGTRTAVATNRGRVQITGQLSVEPGLTVERVRLPQGSFTTVLLTSRTSYTLTPRMSASALMQLNSGAETFNTNVRFRWEYQPGSDLFFVYTDGRDTRVAGFPEIRNRGVTVKLTRLFRL
jgi:hypothetical protein